MRAAILRDGKICLDELPAPEPLAGQVLVKTLACGICGSDLHAQKFGPELAANDQSGGLFSALDFSRDLIMGHEFCAEIVEFGRDTRRDLSVGQAVCSVPGTMLDGGWETVGYSNNIPGGYGEYMVLSEAMLLPIPDGLPINIAALTEPMAVGYHAVQKSAATKDDVPLVVGCGPVGLAVIWALKRKGLGPVIAADYSPLRRQMAIKMGADIVVDPKDTAPHEAWQKAAALAEPSPTTAALARAASAFRPALVFECVGVPGVIQEILLHTPRDARIVIVGVCMQEDRFQPYLGIIKEISMQFVLGYTPEEFAETLRMISDGQTDLSDLITGEVDLTGVAGAFDELANPDKHAKIMVRP
jgi:threonine dehydrogenase-like Zn-dependent dehydrogenase